MPTSNRFPYQDKTKPIEERVEDLLSRMSISEKTTQLMHDSPPLPELEIHRYNWWNECLHGVARNGKATVFPQPILSAASFDVDMIERIGDAIADEARAKFNAVIAKTGGDTRMYQGLSFWTPNINIFRDPRWGRGHETYGEDPYMSGELGAALVRGLQGSDPERLKTSACAKHFAVHSGPELERHSFDAHCSLKDLWETYLPAFKRLIDENVESVMGAYNRTLGEPCCGSKLLLIDILRDQWQFKGHVVSDCWAVRDFHEHHKVTATPAESAALACKMGCDINCGCIYTPHLFEAYELGLVTEEDINKCLRRVLQSRFKLGLFDFEDDHPYNKIGKDVIRCQKHRDLAEEAALKGCVLLKNNNQCLPITKEEGSIYLAGPNAASVGVLLGNYFGISPQLTTLLEGVAGIVPDGLVLNYSKACELHVPNVSPRSWVAYEVGNSDLGIMAMGLDPMFEGEEGEAINASCVGDRDAIKLKQPQVDFIKQAAARGTPLVLVLFGGSAIDISEVEEYFQAILWAGYPGEAGGDAIAKLLFGKQSPSGKLPMTFPYQHQLKDFRDYDMDGRTYRFQKDKPLYPFGFGLSYTTFSYSNPSIDSAEIKTGQGNRVQATVTNTGEREAEEVVQCYLTKPGISSRAALCELVGFKRISLKPGEAQDVSFELSADALNLISDSGDPITEAGTYKVCIASSSPNERSLELGAPEPASITFMVS